MWRAMWPWVNETTAWWHWGGKAHSIGAVVVFFLGLVATTFVYRTRSQVDERALAVFLGVFFSAIVALFWPVIFGGLGSFGLVWLCFECASRALGRVQHAVEEREARREREPEATAPKSEPGYREGRCPECGRGP